MARGFDLRFEMETAPPEIMKVARLKATPILDTIPEEQDLELAQDVCQMGSPCTPSSPSEWSHSDRRVSRAFLQSMSQDVDI